MASASSPFPFPLFILRFGLVFLIPLPSPQPCLGQDIRVLLRVTPPSKKLHLASLLSRTKVMARALLCLTTSTTSTRSRVTTLLSRLTGGGTVGTSSGFALASLDLILWILSEYIREPAAEFTGVMLLIIFGTGVDCQIVLSTNPGVSGSPKGVR